MSFFSLQLYHWLILHLLLKFHHKRQNSSREGCLQNVSTLWKYVLTQDSFRSAPSLFYSTDADELNKYFAPSLVSNLYANLQSAHQELSQRPFIKKKEREEEMLKLSNRNCSCKENMGMSSCTHITFFVNMPNFYSYPLAQQTHAKKPQRPSLDLLLFQALLTAKGCSKASSWFWRFFSWTESTVECLRFLRLCYARDTC